VLSRLGAIRVASRNISTRLPRVRSLSEGLPRARCRRAHTGGPETAKPTPHTGGPTARGAVCGAWSSKAFPDAAEPFQQSLSSKAFPDAAEPFQPSLSSKAFPDAAKQLESHIARRWPVIYTAPAGFCALHALDPPHPGAQRSRRSIRTNNSQSPHAQHPQHELTIGWCWFIIARAGPGLASLIDRSHTVSSPHAAAVVLRHCPKWSAVGGSGGVGGNASAAQLDRCPTRLQRLHWALTMHCCRCSHRRRRPCPGCQRVYTYSERR
jgi:hypothetical protein